MSDPPNHIKSFYFVALTLSNEGIIFLVESVKHAFCKRHVRNLYENQNLIEVCMSLQPFYHVCQGNTELGSKEITIVEHNHTKEKVSKSQEQKVMDLSKLLVVSPQNILKEG